MIGVVTSTPDTLAAVRAAGQVPQNVNFALKSDYPGHLRIGRFAAMAPERWPDTDWTL